MPVGVVLDNTAFSGFATSTGTISLNITVGSFTNMAIMALVCVDNSTHVTSVSGAGASGWALVTGADAGPAGAKNLRSTIWGASAPTSGVQTVTWNFADLSVGGIIGLVTAYNVNQTNSVYRGIGQTDTTTQEELAVTTGIGDMAVDIMGAGGGTVPTFTVNNGDANQTQQFNGSGLGGSAQFVVSTIPATLASSVFGWAVSPSILVIHAAAAFQTAQIPLGVYSGIPGLPILLQTW